MQRNQGSCYQEVWGSTYSRFTGPLRKVTEDPPFSAKNDRKEVTLISAHTWSHHNLSSFPLKSRTAVQFSQWEGSPRVSSSWHQPEGWHPNTNPRLPNTQKCLLKVPGVFTVEAKKPQGARQSWPLCRTVSGRALRVPVSCAGPVSTEQADAAEPAGFLPTPQHMPDAPASEMAGMCDDAARSPLMYISTECKLEHHVNNNK